MPRLVSAGIWRGVRLEFPKPTRWRGVYVATRSVDLEKRAARIVVDWDFTTDRDIDNIQVLVKLSAIAANSQIPKFPNSQIFEYPATGAHGRAELELADAEFWWPLGSGEASLYEFTAELKQGEITLDTWRENVGVRTIELRRAALTNMEGEGEFCFFVNGERVFVKGTNWVPLDALHSRDAELLGSVFPMIADLGCNMVRCWGGNVYEDHAFFDKCDRAGIMVWQDFALGCALYPQTAEFHETMRVEAEAVVRKLRNHPSLALWAGNNECDEAYDWCHMPGNPNKDDIITRQIFPRVLRRWDPLRPYLPSSPFRAPEFYAQDKPFTKVLPEQHLWGARDDFKGPTYTESAAHFASEIGYHACPSRASLEKYIPADELWPVTDSPSWLAKAVQPHPHFHGYDYRIGLMKKQVAFLFGKMPDNLDDFVFASQTSQAEALKFFIEFFRVTKWRRTGLLWWNLRDGWPVVSDAIVDYYNDKKLAYDVVKRSQAPVAAICAEAVNGEHEVFVVNDTRKAAKGTLTGGACSPNAPENGDVFPKRPFGGFGETALPFEIAANSRGRVCTLPQAAGQELWKFEWTLEDGTAGWNHYLAGPRPFDLALLRAAWARI